MIKRPEEIVGSLLTIGDELLQGDIPNGNSHHIASELRSRGFRLNRIVTVGDREEEIVDFLSKCVTECRFFIVTGGLGPTDDDRTGSAASKAFNRPLVLNTDYMSWLQKRLAERGLAWSEQLGRMAHLPQGATKLGWEMAGFFIEYENIPCYFLPGVPHEMKTLLSEVVIPDLEQRFPHRMVYTKHILRVQGLMESEMNLQLKDLSLDQIGIDIGYLPQVGENWVTLFVTGESRSQIEEKIKKAEAQIIPRLGPQHISGHNDECLEKVIGQQLLRHSWKIAVAESCTGGLLSHKITAISGASDYFDRGFITYSNQAKMDLLGVPEQMLLAHGAVSEPVARAMAEGACRQAKADVSLAITGIAGPTGGTPAKPVGTVFIACVSPRKNVVEKYLFGGNREHIQESAAQAALALLWRTLSDDPNLHCH